MKQYMGYEACVHLCLSLRSATEGHMDPPEPCLIPSVLEVLTAYFMDNKRGADQCLTVSVGCQLAPCSLGRPL